MKKKYIIGIDQSTSGTKIVLVNEQGQIEYKKTKEHKQYYPNPGWVEHNPEEIFENCVCLLKECFLFADQNEYFIEGISITNQRETVVFWDDKTKKPLCNAIVWQCRRSTQICSDMKNLNYSKIIEEKTGLHLDPYFSASKIKWALDNDINVMKSAEEKSLRIGTIDAWLIYKLTGNQVFKTDHTNASRTMLYNINSHTWDLKLLNLFSVEKYMLPTIHFCNDIYGKTDERIVGKSITIAGVIGDSQGALFGQQCFEEGMGKATYGTGSSILLYVG
ncbi:MAG: glycerol kinase, partial [Bacteroidales bacterium]|nr:glycerol kinase [Bacteroidales bacterium]